MRLHPARALPAALFAAVLLVAGCGDDDADEIIPPLDEDVQDTTGAEITPDDDENEGTTTVPDGQTTGGTAGDDE
jgi:hypothetical protein